MNGGMLLLAAVVAFLALTVSSVLPHGEQARGLDMPVMYQEGVNDARGRGLRPVVGHAEMTDLRFDTTSVDSGEVEVPEILESYDPDTVWIWTD